MTQLQYDAHRSLSRQHVNILARRRWPARCSTQSSRSSSMRRSPAASISTVFPTSPLTTLGKHVIALGLRLKELVAVPQLAAASVDLTFSARCGGAQSHAPNPIILCGSGHSCLPSRRRGGHFTGCPPSLRVIRNRSPYSGRAISARSLPATQSTAIAIIASPLAVEPSLASWKNLLSWRAESGSRILRLAFS